MNEIASPAPRRHGRRRRRGARVLGILLLLFVLVVGALGVAAWTMFYTPATDVPSGSGVRVEIVSGMTTAVIGEELASRGVVDNANMFRLKTRLAGEDSALEAGSYDLITGMEYEDVIATLRRGPQITYVKLTIPEGWTIDRIAERIEAELGIPAGEFASLAKGGASQFESEHPYLAGAYDGSLEGYLFPKTYEIVEGASAADVIEVMLAQFETEIAGVDLAYAASRNLTPADVVIIASIVEREAKLASERPLVASVVYNRLKKGMRLEMCATVEYVLPGGRLRLTNADLQIDSPYNTYRNTGLTPGPISNPGLASLQAAAAPADTQYLFYVLTGEDGSHTFTNTYAEFQQAKKRSKEVLGQ